jgi:hypothetical protein
LQNEGDYLTLVFLHPCTWARLGSGSLPSSERQFQAELNFARISGAADCAEAVVCAGLRAGSASRLERGEDAVELGVVPRVEEFGAELEDGILVGEPARMAAEPRNVEILVSRSTTGPPLKFIRLY